MAQRISLNSSETALIEAITAWWSKEMEDKARYEGWNVYLVTFMFNHIPGTAATKLKTMQDSVSRFYSKMITHVVRKPNSFIVYISGRKCWLLLIIRFSSTRRRIWRKYG